MAQPPRRRPPTRPPPREDPARTTDPSGVPVIESPERSAGSTDELPPSRALARRGDIPVRQVRDPKRRVPTSRGAEGGKRSPLIAVLAVVVLGVVGAGAWLKLKTPPPVAKPDPALNDLEAAKLAFQEGKNLVRKGQWKLAVQQFDEAGTLAPDLEGLEPYVRAARTEVPLQVRLDAAAEALDKHEVGRAAKELAAVPESTQQLTRRTELNARLGKVVDERLKDARALATATNDKAKMQKLKALAEDVLVARPNDRDALQFLETANRVLGWRAPVVVVDPGDPAAEVIALYAGGDATGAFAKAEECSEKSPRCKQLVGDLGTLIELIKKVESLEAPELEKATKLDRAIAGRSSAFARPACVRLGAVLLPKASSAAAMKQWSVAIKSAKKILECDPGSLAAQELVREGRQAANELYQRCYVGRATTPDESLPLCKEVVEILPEGDELRNKAQRLIDSSRVE